MQIPPLLTEIHYVSKLVSRGHLRLPRGISVQPGLQEAASVTAVAVQLARQRLDRQGCRAANLYQCSAPVLPKCAAFPSITAHRNKLAWYPPAVYLALPLTLDLGRAIQGQGEGPSPPPGPRPPCPYIGHVLPWRSNPP